MPPGCSNDLSGLRVELSAAYDWYSAPRNVVEHPGCSLGPAARRAPGILAVVLLGIEIRLRLGIPSVMSLGAVAARALWIVHVPGRRSCIRAR